MWSSLLGSLSALALLSKISLAYTWPDKFDTLEDIYTITSGFGSQGMIDEVTPCEHAPIRQDATGRQAAAEWVRLNYHDMANYQNGKGGLDASIGWETERPQNIGSAMNTSLTFFGRFVGKDVSMADTMALGAIIAIKACGGPSVPFRAGRIDASEPGPETVPEPHQDLASHTAAFERVGFNLTEMITLVACGHTIGGVHQVDFPTVVKDHTTPTNTDGIARFDSSFAEFDNTIATAWVNGTSTDPLAVGFNGTTNSDARIFASDNNKTMQALATNAELFASRCSELLGRMLDTVPVEVTLSPVVQHVPVKPYAMQLSLNALGQLSLRGYIRIFDDSPDAAAASPVSMPVSITWKDRTSQSCSDCATSLSYYTDPIFGTPGSVWGSLYMFSIDTTIDPRASISSFVVDWSFDAASALTRANNGGNGFPLQDLIMLQPSQSCADSSNISVNVTTAIRTSSINVSAAYVIYTYNIAQTGTAVVKIQTARYDLKKLLTPASSPLYTLWGVGFGQGPQTFSGVNSFDLVLEMQDGKTYLDQTKNIIDMSSSCFNVPV